MGEGSGSREVFFADKSLLQCGHMYVRSRYCALEDTDIFSDKSVNDVKTALEESDRQAARTTPAIHETSPTACLMLGLLVEEMQ